MTDLCMCGKPYTSTAGSQFKQSVSLYDSKGVPCVIYAVCQHGTVVIDRKDVTLRSLEYPALHNAKELQ